MTLLIPSLDLVSLGLNVILIISQSVNVFFVLIFTFILILQCFYVKSQRIRP